MMDKVHVVMLYCLVCELLLNLTMGQYVLK